MNIREELGKELEEAEPLMREIIDALTEFERRMIEHDKIKRILIKLFEYILNIAKKGNITIIKLREPCRRIGQKVKYLEIDTSGKIIYGETKCSIDNNEEEKIELVYKNGKLFTYRELKMEDIEKILEILRNFN